jgi:sarcosine oxidase subunit beta
MANDPHSTYDVIIIGAGSIGAPAAMFLAQTGLKVLVVERDPSVGQESSKRAIGGIRATHSDPAKISLGLRSIEIFSTWQERYGNDIEWHRGGYCFVAYRTEEEKSLQDLLIAQKRYGLNINWYDANELRKRIPDLNPLGLHGGTLSPDDGSASPLLATHAFYTQSLKQGARFVFNEKVVGIERSNGKVTGVRTERSIYHGGIVINTAGAWAAEIARMVDMEIPVQPDSHEAAITEPVAPFLEPMIVDIRPSTGSANYYFYQHSTGQIVFCITPSPSIWGFDTRETSSFLPMVAKRMIDIMPRLKNIRVRRTWRGLYPMTPDGFPIIGWSQTVQGFLLAAGMCGQGFMLGPGVAELLVRLVRQESRPQDGEILRYVDPYREFTGQERLK